MKNLRKSWSRLWIQPCLARFKTECTGKSVARTSPVHAAQNTHVSRKPTNLRRSALDKSQQKDHEDRRQVFNSLSHFNRLHKFIPLPQAMKIPDAKAAVEVIHEAQKERGKDSSFCYADGHMPPQKHGAGSEVPKKQRLLCSEVTLGKTILALTRYLQSKVHQPRK